MLNLQPEKSVDQRIREEFEVVGGSMTTAAFTRHCMDAGIWSDEELDTQAFRSCQGDVRSALKKPDVFGLPFAGKTTEKEDDGSARVWRQRVFWTYDDYAMNIGDLVSERDVLHQNALLLQSECFAKFGKAPNVPDFSMIRTLADDDEERESA